MGNVIGKTRSELKQIENCLKKEIPSYRQAYSDRTCWLMACVCELSYLKFNEFKPSMAKKDCFLENIHKLLERVTEKTGNNSFEKYDKKALRELLDNISYDHKVEEKKLVDDLGLLEMELVDKYDEEGTQAIIVKYRDSIILIFRGTEATSYKDIRTNLKAGLTQDNSSAGAKGKLHEGFHIECNRVIGKIEKTLNRDDLKDKKLFITGHSLGGALAVVATKRIKHSGGIAACYTFGMPRVGNKEWIARIKTPIYRLVNSLDCVTMLPLNDEIVHIIALSLKIIPVYGSKFSDSFLSKFEGYMHCGNMRYLTDCNNGDYNNVDLLYSVSLWIRLKVFMRKLLYKSFLKDHSIKVYRNKLFVIATRKNKQ